MLRTIFLQSFETFDRKPFSIRIPRGPLTWTYNFLLCIYNNVDDCLKKARISNKNILIDLEIVFRVQEGRCAITRRCNMQIGKVYRTNDEW